MIIVIFLFCVGLIFLGVWLYDNDHETTGCAISTCGIIGGIVSFIALVILLVNVSGLKVIDTKIEMYQDENTKIESQITECIKQYQQYEKDIFTEVTPDSAVTLVTLYPELKSDTLVSKQIDIYLENNQTIKNLKAKKINGSVWRWWLYFG
jgi:hypothetical protein